jgi:hypothetical protein
MSFGNLFADPLTFGLGIVVGLAMGAIVAAICLAEPSKHLWIVVLRLSPDLHRRLRRSAKAHETTLHAEIVARLEDAFIERPRVVNLPERPLLLQKTDHSVDR